MADIFGDRKEKDCSESRGSQKCSDGEVRGER